MLFVWFSDKAILGSFFLYLQNFFYTSKLSLNFQKSLWPFKETRRHHTPKIMSFGNQNIWLPELKIYQRKSTSGSQNVSPNSKVKDYHWKSTSESKKIFPKINFWKLKDIPGSRLLEVKKHSPEINFRKSKKIFILNIFNSFQNLYSLTFNDFFCLLFYLFFMFSYFLIYIFLKILISIYIILFLFNILKNKYKYKNK